MSLSRLLLCTDMDRTLIPNGSQPEHPDARNYFRAFCCRPEVTLVYVTGRHRALVKQAIQSYDLPEPDFAITDVGTKIYQIIDGEWLEMDIWGETIAEDWQGKSHAQIKQALSPMTELTQQEEEKQNTFKLSYYLPLDADKDRVIDWMENRLSQMGVKASLVWSIDEPENIGLLDVLPLNATKLH
ncbi:MAG: haloacid dehalogenase, partial [Candidatus Zixiibacteriota bacterium]